MFQTEFKCLRCAAAFAIEAGFKETERVEKVRCPRCGTSLVFARFRSSDTIPAPAPQPRFNLADIMPRRER